MHSLEQWNFCTMPKSINFKKEVCKCTFAANQEFNWVIWSCGTKQFWEKCSYHHHAFSTFFCAGFWIQSLIYARHVLYTQLHPQVMQLSLCFITWTNFNLDSPYTFKNRLYGPSAFQWLLVLLDRPFRTFHLCSEVVQSAFFPCTLFLQTTSI